MSSASVAGRCGRRGWSVSGGQAVKPGPGGRLSEEAEMQEIHVALVEKNQLFREGLRVLLERHFTSVVEAADAEEALACVDPAHAAAVDLLILSGAGAVES